MIDLIPTLRACRIFVISCRAEAKGRNESRFEHTGELLETIDAALAAALSTEPGEAEGWRDISTAPKNGSRIQLLATKLGRMKLLPDILWIKVGSWRKHHEDGYEFAWREDAVAAPVNIGRARLAPTHWRDLPAAPLPEDTHHG